MKNMHAYYIQEAIRQYFETNLATYADGIAAHIPVVEGFGYNSIEPPVLAVVCNKATNKQPTALFDGTRYCEVLLAYMELEDVAVRQRFATYSAITDLVYDTNFLVYVNSNLLAIDANIMTQYMTIEEETFSAEGSIHQMMMALTIMTYTIK